MRDTELQEAREDSKFIDLDSPIEPRPIACPIPLTTSQARIWNGSLKESGERPSLRMCASAVRVEGPLSLVVLQNSIEIVIRRHEALRTRIVVKSGRPYQDIEPAPMHGLTTIDLSGQPRGEVVRLVEEFIRSHIDLATGPLFEARVWRLSDKEHFLVLLIDHIVSDGISNGIIARELWECYRRGVLGLPVDLPQIPVQFPDYALWQARTRLAWMEHHAGYWRQHLCGAKSTVIPADKDLSGGQRATETIKHIPFGDELTAALRGAARRERTLVSVLVLAAYAVVLSAWCRTEDLLLVFASHARHRSVLRNVVGFLADMLYLRIHVRRDQAFCELIAQVKRELANALEHRDFGRVAELLPKCATKVGFNWQSTHSAQGPMDHYVATECEYSLSRSVDVDLGVGLVGSPTTERIRVLPFPVRSPGSPTTFIPVIFDTPSTLLMMIRFDPNVLSPNTVEKFSRRLFVVAEESCRCPTPKIASLLEKIDEE